ncbi:MAG: hypothetical protein PHS79_03975 [Patescibacteria group bacterium]|nr:hypothetical protein [Patescibacteria group bacterium]
MTEIAPPQGLADLLDPIIEYHRDRDEAPIFFRYEYVLGDSPFRQAQYDAAVSLWVTHLATLPQAELTSLADHLGRWNGLGVLAERARERILQLSLAEQLAHAGIAAYLNQRFCDLSIYLVPGVPPGSRVLAMYPELEKALTVRDSLLPVRGGVTPGHAWVGYKAHDIHVHPGLRRGYANRVHYGLLKMLWDCRAAGLEVSIAIDHFRICPKGVLRPVMELDRWFGAPFRREAVDDPRQVGTTLHERVYDTSPFDRAGLRTEFSWTLDGSLKTFVVEELPVPREEEGDRPVICRFVHSIRDIESHHFTHLDGAIKVYDSTLYAERYAQAPDHTRAKVWAGDKVKLFRIDVPNAEAGPTLDDDAWMEIITSFFRGNELVLEYFSGKTFREIYQEEFKHDHPYIAAQQAGLLGGTRTSGPT